MVWYIARAELKRRQRHYWSPRSSWRRKSPSVAEGGTRVEGDEENEGDGWDRAVDDHEGFLRLEESAIDAACHLDEPVYTVQE